MEVLVQKHVEKNSKGDRKKIGSKTFPKSYRKLAKRTLIYRGPKTRRYGLESGQIVLSVGRLTNGHNMTISRSTDRSTDRPIWLDSKP